MSKAPDKGGTRTAGPRGAHLLQPGPEGVAEGEGNQVVVVGQCESSGGWRSGTPSRCVPIVRRPRDEDVDNCCVIVIAIAAVAMGE